MSAQVLGYVRVSTLDQAREGFSLEDQRRTLREEARRRRWREFEIVGDEGESGRHLDRPGLSSALDALGCGQADTLVVARLDRLSRSLLDFAALMARARHEGWAVIALDLGVDMTTPSGRLMANVMASFAEYERHIIRERVSAGREQKAREGVGWIVGRPPYGYRVEAGHLVRDDLQSAIVRFIFKRAAQGWPNDEIGRQLTARGYASPGGVDGWDAQAVRRIRRRTTYRGDYRFRGHRVRCEAIVGKKLWREAQGAG